MIYVVGFAFDTQKRVALIRKTHPEWQAGKYNGVGGKVTDQDISRLTASATGIQCAMAREFEEEAGLLILPERWKHYHTETWPNGNVVNFLATGLYPGEWVESKTEEMVEMRHWFDEKYFTFVQKEDFVYNLNYLIPMAYTFLMVKPELLPQHRAA
jgi:8-oxo-dGTP diphosphatase